MTCKNCGQPITKAKSGPKPWISITPKGSYGSFICSSGAKVFIDGHEPGDTIA